MTQTPVADWCDVVRQGSHLAACCLLLVLLLILSGTSMAAQASRATAPIPPVLTQAKNLIDRGDHESAATVLRRFLAGSPSPEHLDDAYLLMGAALFGMKEYSESLKVLTQLETEFPSSEVADR